VASGAYPGGSQQLGTMMSANVDSVSLGKGGSISLNLAGMGSIDLSQVQQINHSNHGRPSIFNHNGQITRYHSFFIRDRPANRQNKKTTAQSNPIRRLVQSHRPKKQDFN
jgi:anthranilate/para-aminobenzoate synthase component II